MTRSPQATARDRHGRGRRGPLAWPPVPSMVSRSQEFDDLVMDSIEDVERRLGRSLQPFEAAVDDVPPPDPRDRFEGVALATLTPGSRTKPTRLVVFRRPVEARARDAGDLAHVVHHVVVDQISQWLGLDPEDLL